MYVNLYPRNTTYSAYLAYLVGGQGITSGFRDAISLAWRLSIACSSKRQLDYERLFEGWYLERKQQLDKSLAATVRNGDLVNGKSFMHSFIRNWGLWFLQLIPSWKHWLEQGPRGDGPTQYIHSPGMPFIPEMSGGLCFPQTYCISLHNNAEAQFTDDVIFAEKRTPFQLVVLLNHPKERDIAVQDLGSIKASPLLSPEEATFFVPRSNCANLVDRAGTCEYPLFRSATGDEFGRSALCESRPLPRGYNEMLMWQSVRGKRYVVLRLDRFVFAACKDRVELAKAVAQLNQSFES